MAAARVLIGTLGLDQHEVGAIAVARLLRDAGMEVIYLGRFNTPESIIRTAIDEDVDVVGISCHSWEYVEYLPSLLRGLKDAGTDMSVVLGGSVITPADAERLKGDGVAAVFGPGARGDAMVATIAELARQRQSKLAGR